MAVIQPAGVGISKDYAFILPKMKQEPLLTALKNCNYLIKFHRPPLVDDCPVDSWGLTRTATFIVPITPSADGMRYTFETRWVCEFATQSVTVTVDYTTAYTIAPAPTWTNIFSQATVSGGAGTETLQTKINQVIPATAVALRYKITAPATGKRDDHHLLVYPGPGDTTVGLLTSGAVPFDDGGLGHADRWPVHTEFINRCKTTAVAVLQDRKQRALSFLGEELTAGWTRAATWARWRDLPAVRCFLPYQAGKVTLDVTALAQISAGLTPARVKVSQLGGDSVVLAATGLIVSGQLEVNTYGDGAMRYVDLRVSWYDDGVNTLYLNSVSAYYTPGQ